jgi:uncharacterized membrane protein
MFQPRFRLLRSRHPLVRLLGGLAGLLAVALVLALGLFALVALAIGGAAWLIVNALRASARPAPASTAKAPAQPAPGVIEGDFTVVSARPPR